MPSRLLRLPRPPAPRRPTLYERLQGCTPLQLLATGAVKQRQDGLENMKAIMKRLRANPPRAGPSA